MKQKLMELGQKITNLINGKLQADNLSPEEYDILLERLEVMVEKELKINRKEIIEVMGNEN